jgi:hypothetical protein
MVEIVPRKSLTGCYIRNYVRLSAVFMNSVTNLDYSRVEIGADARHGG